MKKKTYLVLFDNLNPLRVEAVSWQTAKILAQATQVAGGKEEKYILHVTHVINDGLEVCGVGVLSTWKSWGAEPEYEGMSDGPIEDAF